MLVSYAKAQDSLLFYLSEAAKNNPAVLQKYSEYQAALHKVPQVGSLPDPELEIGVFLNPMELVSGNQVADLRLMQMFPWFGTLRAAKDEMSLMANAKFESFRTAELLVIYEVQQTWYEMYKVRQKIAVSEKNMEILRTIERLALAGYKGAWTGTGNTSVSTNALPANVSQTNNGNSTGMGGMGSITGPGATVSVPATSQGMQANSMGSSGGNVSLTDLYRIQMEIGELEYAAAALKGQQNTLVTKFNGFLNRPPVSPVSLPDSISAESLNMPLEAGSDSMLANNPMLGMLQFEQQSLDSRNKMVAKMQYPMIGVGLNYSVINKNEMSASPMNGKDMVMPMVTLTLPIYRRKYKAMQSEVGMLKTATSQNYAASANELKTVYFQAVQLYQDAQRRLHLFTNQRLLSGKSLEIMIKSYAGSATELSDILRIQQQNLDYSYKQIESVADINTAVALLKRLMAFQQIQQN